MVVECVPLLLALGGIVVVLVVGDVVGVTSGDLGQCGGREGVQQRLNSSQHVPAAAQQHSLQNLNFAPREEPHQGLHAGQFCLICGSRRRRYNCRVFVLLGCLPPRRLAGPRLLVFTVYVLARCGRLGQGLGVGRGGRRRLGVFRGGGRPNFEAEGLLPHRRRRGAAPAVIFRAGAFASWRNRKKKI